ncbi:flagellar biosynthesis protein FlhB [Rhodospirillum centenum]|uniref:Flagellar biosynthetic protein FlhB n=1 Tax=Rhodospirillum centenum (strain ATCC 51521 / SW) TaxID=414684 RepID=B6IS89_RHOCS|nr:flagellar biosynthesis protein FlhB [Rhodospirillum centenum]ACI98325.1 flagellar biosynthetic protein FlhB [Rhodospirillum centenum SW]
MAEDQDQDSKTEEPTDKKLSDAREKGQVAKSMEVGNLFILASGLVMVLLLLPWSGRILWDAMMPFVERPHAILMAPAALGDVLTDLTLDIAFALAPTLVLLLLAALAAPIIQVGLMFSAENVFKFDLNKVNPLTGLKNKVSLKNLVEFLKSLGKLVLVGIVVSVLLLPLWTSIEHFLALPLPSVIVETRHEAAKLIAAVVIVLGAIAGADYAFQRYQFMQQMRMTKQEVKDEYKQTEGDPLIKSKIRQLRMQRSRNRMMAAVPSADVVVTNPTHFAVALKYDASAMSAPRVVAKGADLIAKRIRELAEEAGVPVISNPPLARALFATAEIDEEIPAEHYKAVAQVISYVFKLKRKPIPT